MEKIFETTTLLGHSAGQIFSLFEEKGHSLRLPVRREGNAHLLLTTPRGEVALTDTTEGVRITLSSTDRAMLHTLQETIDGNLDRFGLSGQRSWSLTDVGALPANIAIAAVKYCTRLSPSYFRVGLYGPGLARFVEGGLHFRLLFPPFEHVGELPGIGADGRTEWPGGIAAWHRPVYTIRSIAADGSGFAFDVFSHEGGRVTAWCDTLLPGMSVALMGPGGEWYPQAGWLALFGDETALPAISRILAASPEATRGQATIMVACEEDIQDLPKPAGVEVSWLIRGGGPSLLDRLEIGDLPRTDRFVWYAGERSEVTAARALLSDKGLEKSEMRAASYWTATDQQAG